MYTFEDAIIHNRELNPDFIASNEMRAVVLPELPSPDEVKQISVLLDESEFDAWTYGSGAAESHILSANIDEVISFFCE